jgi:hypothetical protein
VAFHALRGDTRAAGLLARCWAHFCEVNGFSGPREVLEWACGAAAAGTGGSGTAAAGSQALAVIPA